MGSYIPPGVDPARWAAYSAARLSGYTPEELEGITNTQKLNDYGQYLREQIDNVAPAPAPIAPASPSTTGSFEKWYNAPAYTRSGLGALARGYLGGWEALGKGAMAAKRGVESAVSSALVPGGPPPLPKDPGVGYSSVPGVTELLKQQKKPAPSPSTTTKTGQEWPMPEDVTEDATLSALEPEKSIEKIKSDLGFSWGSQGADTRPEYDLYDYGSEYGHRRSPLKVPVKRLMSEERRPGVSVMSSPYEGEEGMIQDPTTDAQGNLRNPDRMIDPLEYMTPTQQRAHMERLAMRDAGTARQTSLAQQRWLQEHPAGPEFEIEAAKRRSEEAMRADTISAQKELAKAARESQPLQTYITFAGLDDPEKFMAGEADRISRALAAMGKPPLKPDVLRMQVQMEYQNAIKEAFRMAGITSPYLMDYGQTGQPGG